MRAVLFIILIRTLSEPISASYDTERIVRFTGIRGHRSGYLVHREGELRIRKSEAPETVWNIHFRKEGLLLAKNVGEKDGAYLGFDPKTKKLALFPEPGPTTYGKRGQVHIWRALRLHIWTCPEWHEVKAQLFSRQAVPATALAVVS